jgi:uncharacterized coiled-coil DUF342 family protein
MRRERDRLQNELNELKEDRDAWKSEALIMDARLRGVKHHNDNGSFSPDEVIPKLERELAAVTEELDGLRQSILDLSHPNMKLLLKERNEVREQRDRLAEALKKFEGCFDCYGCVGTAEEALAAVKGGSSAPIEAAKH